MILYVDMDGVVADFAGCMQKLLPNIELGDGDPSTYKQRSEAVHKAARAHPHLFKSLDEIEGGIDAVELLSHNYEIYFLSTPMNDVPESYTDKRLWLHEKFGAWADKRLVLTHRKDLVIGDILIDDSRNNGADGFKGEFIHFGSEKYPNWESVLKHLII